MRQNGPARYFLIHGILIQCLDCTYITAYLLLVHTCPILLFEPLEVPKSMANACGTNLCLSVAGGNRGFSRACSSTQFRRPEECAHWNHAKCFLGGIIYCIVKHFLRAKNALTQSGRFFPCGIPQLWTLRCCLDAGATPTPSPPPPLPSGPLRGLAYAPPLVPQR